MAARMGNGRAGNAAAGRGLLLVLVALVIGVLLLSQVDGDGDVDAVAADDGSTSTETTEGGTDGGEGGEGTETTDDVPSIDPETGDTIPADQVPDTEAPVVTEPPLAVRDPSEVTVLVVNGGTGIQGAAGRLSDQIQPFGYLQADPTNATDAVGQVAVSQIYYEAGWAAEANKLAGELGWPIESVQPMPEPPPVDALDGANLLVLLGTDNATPA
ncbi:MAG: LytR C-terminal domain-containing protein [Actinomycetota bacterium]